MIENYAQLIANVGFPIVISLYVLMRLEKTLKENTKVIRELCIKLNSN
jgi:hypothetical protein